MAPGLPLFLRLMQSQYSSIVDGVRNTQRQQWIDNCEQKLQQAVTITGPCIVDFELSREDSVSTSIGITSIVLSQEVAEKYSMLPIQKDSLYQSHRRFA